MRSNSSSSPLGNRNETGMKTDKASPAPFGGAPNRERRVQAAGRELRLLLVAGGHSGDALGAKLMAALNAARRGRIRYVGVGGAAMEALGLISQFPMEEVAVMGPGAIVRRLPVILSRITTTAAAVIGADPDALIIIDSPPFTHRIPTPVRPRRPPL